MQAPTFTRPSTVNAKTAYVQVDPTIRRRVVSLLAAIDGVAFYLEPLPYGYVNIHVKAENSPTLLAVIRQAIPKEA